jgi:GNAT superfamily N-acetyltransferase
LPTVEQSAAQLFRQIAALAWVADGGVQSEARHLSLIQAGATLVAVDAADAPIGFANAEPLDGALHVGEIAVQIDHQRRGAGRALMVRTQQWAVDRGLRAVTLTTFRDIAWNGLFYQSLGFAPVAPGDLTEGLRAILASETARGLDATHPRCAMRWEA